MLRPNAQAGEATQGSSAPDAEGCWRPGAGSPRGWPAACIPAAGGERRGPSTTTLCSRSLPCRSRCPSSCPEARGLPAVSLHRTRSDLGQNKAPLLRSFREAADSKTPGSRHSLVSMSRFMRAANRPAGASGASRAGAGQGDKAERNWAGSRGPSASLKAGGPRPGCPSREGPGAGRSRRAWHTAAPGRCFWNEGLNHRKADTAQPSGRPELRSCCSKASWRGPWSPAHQTQGPFSVPKEAQRPEGQASTVPGLTAAPRTPGPGTCQHRLPAVSASGPADLCPRHRHCPAKVPAGDPAPQCGRGSSPHHLYPPIPHEPRA